MEDAAPGVPCHSPQRGLGDPFCGTFDGRLSLFREAALFGFRVLDDGRGGDAERLGEVADGRPVRERAGPSGALGAKSGGAVLGAGGRWHFVGLVCPKIVLHVDASCAFYERERRCSHFGHRGESFFFFENEG